MYNEQQLAEFGNYLLRTYNVQVYSTDGRNTPLYERQVTDADLANWRHDAPDRNAWFPSRYNIGDQVVLSICQVYGENPYPLKAKILSVHFYEGKVKYDLEIPVETGPPTRMYNIDSCFVLPNS